MFLRSKLLNLRAAATQQTIRTFLSDNFACTNEWTSRLSPPFMSDVKADRFYYDVQQDTKSWAIDLDMYVNKVTPADVHIDEITHLLEKIRAAESATDILDSTSHAVVRNLVESNNFQELIHVLENRLTFGVFLDNFSASYALNALIKKGDFHLAARVATLLMLDEDFSHPLTQSFSLYSVIKYLEKCEPFFEPEPEPVPVKGKVTEVKVRVAFLRNEFFNDHFDLKDNKHLVGKTLVILGHFLEPQLSQNAKLLGYILYQKYDKALEFLNSVKSENIYKDVVDLCIQNSEEGSDLKAKLEGLGNLKSEKFEDVAKAYLEKCVKEHESKTVEEQKQLYSTWNELREVKYNDKLKAIEKEKRLSVIEKKMEDLRVEEEKLWFFENEDKIDLGIDSKIVRYPKRWFGKLKKPRTVDAGYVPPEIIKQRN